METVKKTKDYTIYKKRSGRHAVINANSEWVKADEKAKILLKEGLIKLTPAKKKDAPAAEAPAEEKKA